MNDLIQFANTIPSIRTLISRSRLRCRFIFIVLVLACIAFLPQTRAACQQGCDLVGANTFLGDDALANNTTGGNNTAIGAACTL